MVLANNMIKLIFVLFFILLPFLGFQIAKSEGCPNTKALFVEYVVDGDTLDLNNNERVRLIGFNTVERGEENFYRQSKNLQDLILNKQIDIIRFGKDRNGRTLGILNTVDSCINAEMRKLLKRRKVEGYDKYDYLLTKEQTKALLDCGWRR